jgi:hypothetical protein
VELIIKSFVFFVLWGVGSGWSQCIKINDIPFKAGEKLTYTVRYAFGLNFDAGEVTFNVDTLKKGKTIFFHFYSTGRSYPSYDKIYEVRDRYDVLTFAQDLRPIYYHRHTSEGGYGVNNIYHFSYKDDKIYMTISHSDSIPYKDTISHIKCVRDALSSAYYLRGLDIKKMKKGHKITIDMLLDGKVYPITITYLGQEKIVMSDTLHIKTYKSVSETIKSSIFRGGEGLYVWVSEDKNKLPVKILAYILVGKVVVFLNDFKGLKYPADSFLYHVKGERN